MLQIVSWNIQQGGGSRIRAIGKALVKLKPTILVLSEYRNNEKGQFLREQLLKAGYRFQFVSESGAQINSVLIASLLPANSYLFQLKDIAYTDRIVEVQFPAFHLIGVYLPHKQEHELFDVLQTRIQQSEQPYIIVGDYNSGINGVDQAGNSFWYEPEMKNFETLNYIDAFRLLHAEVKEYSWFSHQGNGYRYDHTYIHKSLAPFVTKCEYLHSWREEEKLSDHSPMLLQLES